jgi:hypothetical protein
MLKLEISFDARSIHIGLVKIQYGVGTRGVANECIKGTEGQTRKDSDSVVTAIYSLCHGINRTDQCANIRLA